MGYAGRGGWSCKTSEVLARPNGRTTRRGERRRAQGPGLRRRACVSRGLRGKRPWSQSRGRGQGRLRTSKTSHAVREIEPLTSEFSDRLIQLPSEYRSARCRRCVGARGIRRRGRAAGQRSCAPPQVGRESGAEAPRSPPAWGGVGHLTKFQLSCPIFPGCPSLAGLSASIYSRADPSRARRRPLSRGRACSD